jgi:hypothetical protein
VAQGNEGFQHLHALLDACKLQQQAVNQCELNGNEQETPNGWGCLGSYMAHVQASCCWKAGHQRTQVAASELVVTASCMATIAVVTVTALQ